MILTILYLIIGIIAASVATSEMYGRDKKEAFAIVTFLWFIILLIFILYIIFRKLYERKKRLERNGRFFKN